jgi:hypothetical protein
MTNDSIMYQILDLPLETAVLAKPNSAALDRPGPYRPGTADILYRTGKSGWLVLGRDGLKDDLPEGPGGYISARQARAWIERRIGLGQTFHILETGDQIKPRLSAGDTVSIGGHDALVSRVFPDGTVKAVVTTTLDDLEV